MRFFPKPMNYTDTIQTENKQMAQKDARLFNSPMSVHQSITSVDKLSCPWSRYDYGCDVHGRDIFSNKVI